MEYIVIMYFREKVSQPFSIKKSAVIRILVLVCNVHVEKF